MCDPKLLRCLGMIALTVTIRLALVSVIISMLVPGVLVIALANVKAVELAATSLTPQNMEGILVSLLALSLYVGTGLFAAFAIAGKIGDYIDVVLYKRES